ncbi:hypothetical protein GOODEAATRI_021765 [Goodea atripinnis]|uniref:Uncharacterized protein n=1 Tax=Goodea atripinnis TaxID=208336 RepID=A0ABV0MJS0_9TELE
MEALRNRPPPPPPRVYSSMEHFLLGLAPSLENLTIPPNIDDTEPISRVIFAVNDIELGVVLQQTVNVQTEIWTAPQGNKCDNSSTLACP